LVASLRCGKPPPCRRPQHPVARNDQRNGILAAAFADIARLPDRRRFLRQGNMALRVAPSDLPRRRVIRWKNAPARGVERKGGNPSPWPANSVSPRRLPRPPPAWACPVVRRGDDAAGFVRSFRRVAWATGSA
jgi:hypothetical protein